MSLPVPGIKGSRGMSGFGGMPGETGQEGFSGQKGEDGIPGGFGQKGIMGDYGSKGETELPLELCVFLCSTALFPCPSLSLSILLSDLTLTLTPAVS